AQRVRAGVLDSRGHEPADQLRSAVEMDELVLAAPPGHARPGGGPPPPLVLVVVVVVASRRRHRVDEDLDVAPDPRPIALEPDRLLAREQLVQAGPLEPGPGG